MVLISACMCAKGCHTHLLPLHGGLCWEVLHHSLGDTKHSSRSIMLTADDTPLLEHVANIAGMPGKARSSQLPPHLLSCARVACIDA